MIIRVIDAQEEERERLARQMHDGPAQSLTNFILQAELCKTLFDKKPDKAREALAKLMTDAHEAFQRIRDFIFDLRPMMLTDLGLVPTLKRYQEAFQNKSGIEIELMVNGRDRRLESYLEVLVFRGIQELMVTARDQGGATNVKVTLEMGPTEIRAVVEDNGRGFATGQLTLDEKTSQPLGLSTLQERVHLVGGSLQIDSVSGQGARIEIEVPAGAEIEGSGEVS
jgi:two-component system sensor histidine kinase DegS